MDPFRRLFGQVPLARDSRSAIEAQPPRLHAQRQHSAPHHESLGYKWEPPTSLRLVLSPSPPPLARSASESDLSFSSTAFLASAAIHRHRLDESAGEGLRRSVLVRNAMLSSLEREGSTSKAASPNLVEPNGKASIQPDSASFPIDCPQDLIEPAEPSIEWDRNLAAEGADLPLDTRKNFEREVQWFEDLLSELGSDDEIDLDDGDCDDGFVAVELPAEDSAAGPQLDAVEPVLVIDASAPVDDLASARTAMDSGFAERRSLSSSTASGPRYGYPYVCPYPSTALAGTGSSEELPALVEDDSDAEYDEDDDDDTPLVESEQQDPLAGALLSSPMSPVEAAPLEPTLYADLLSPPSTRPGSPTLSSSSKADSDHSIPTGLCESPSGLPLLSELALRSATTRGRHVDSLDLALARTCRSDAQDGLLLAVPSPPPITCQLPWQPTDHEGRFPGAGDGSQRPCCGVVEEYSCPPSVKASSSSAGCLSHPATPLVSAPGTGCTLASSLAATRRGDGIVCRWRAA